MRRANASYQIVQVVTPSSRFSNCISQHRMDPDSRKHLITMSLPGTSSHGYTIDRWLEGHWAKRWSS